MYKKKLMNLLIYFKAFHEEMGASFCRQVKKNALQLQSMGNIISLLEQRRQGI